jgi:hypothetical protein
VGRSLSEEDSGVKAVLGQRDTPHSDHGMCKCSECRPVAARPSSDAVRSHPTVFRSGGFRLVFHGYGRVLELRVYNVCGQVSYVVFASIPTPTRAPVMFLAARLGQLANGTAGSPATCCVLRGACGTYVSI